MVQDFIPMDTQKQTEMTHKETEEDRPSRPTEDITEEQFLKELYLFMKKRDTPIERIPHLGFRQIDLFVMFKTVKELGGYHQVTAQQLWKQVYNTLGGNPRSTSAATCTRRHYEKLLLPYECHIKGLHINAVPQPRNFHYYNYRKEDNDGQIPAKRRAMLFPLQNPPGVMSDHHSGVFQLSPSYHKFYYPHNPFAPPPHSLLHPQRPPAPPQPYIPCPPAISTSTDRHKDPLEHLRYLAKQYESSAGLAEPLNLSVKASSSETTTNPVSSFAPPVANKTPKFLNPKPTPLYTSPNSSVKGQADSGVVATSFFNKSAEEGPQIKGSPPAMSNDSDSVQGQTNKKATEMAAKNSSPKSEERNGSPDVRSINDVLSRSTRENGGRMEIEIPLSVFNNWLHMYGPQATLQSSRQLLIEGESAGNSSQTEGVPANLTIEIKHSETNGQREDMKISTPATNDPYASNQYHLNKHVPSCGPLKNAVSRDVYPYDVSKQYSLKSPPPDYWEVTHRGGQNLSKQVNGNASPPSLHQDLNTSKPFDHGHQQPKSEKQAMLMLNSSATSLLQLTPEEVMKLKKIISNSA